MSSGVYKKDITATKPVEGVDTFHAPGIPKNATKSLQDISDASRKMKERSDAASVNASLGFGAQISSDDVALSALRHHKVLAAHAENDSLVVSMLDKLTQSVESLKETVRALPTREEFDSLKETVVSLKETVVSLKETADSLKETIATREELDSLKETVASVDRRVEAMDGNHLARLLNRKFFQNARFTGRYSRIKKAAAEPEFDAKFRMISVENLSRDAAEQVAGALYQTPPFFPETGIQINGLTRDNVVRLMKFYENTFGIDDTTAHDEYASFFKDWIAF